MSWIDDELAAERRKTKKAETDAERELHRAKLIESKAAEVWELLKAECQAGVNEFVSKCGSGPECVVTFSDIPTVNRFIVRFEHQRRTRAEVILQLNGYKIEVKHSTPTANFPMEEHAAPWYLTFDTDGLTVLLKSAGRQINIESASQRILRPVLFSREA